MEVVTGYPIRDDVMPGHVKVGWRASFELPVYLLPTGRPARPAPGAPKWLPALGLAATGYRIASRPLRRTRRGTATWLAPDAFAADPRVDALCAPSPAVDRLARPTGFWRWRLARPGVDYRCLVTESGGTSAYAVVRELELRGVPSLAVLDLAASGPAALDLALDRLVALARERRCVTLACCANRAHAGSLGLGRRGFVRTPLTFTLIHRATAPGALDERFRDGARWRMSWLDADTV